MKVLVYGAGVIGCYLAHTLCSAGKDVTLLARDELIIVHHLQKQTTHDQPRIIRKLDNCAHDAVFAVMQ